MTATKAEPSRESILEEIEINQRIGADHRFSEKEWSVIIAALRAPAGEPVAPNNGESLITVKIPEGYASTWDFLNDCGLEVVYPTAPAGGEGVRLPEIAPNKCFCCKGDLYLNGANYCCDRGSSESFCIDDLAALAPRGAEPVNSHAAPTSRVEELEKALREISELYQGGHGYRAVGIARAALQTGGGK